MIPLLLLIHAANHLLLCVHVQRFVNALKDNANVGHVLRINPSVSAQLLHVVVKRLAIVLIVPNLHHVHAQRSVNVQMVNADVVNVLMIRPNVFVQLLHVLVKVLVVVNTVQIFHVLVLRHVHAQRLVHVQKENVNVALEIQINQNVSVQHLSVLVVVTACVNTVLRKHVHTLTFHRSFLISIESIYQPIKYWVLFLYNRYYV